MKTHLLKLTRMMRVALTIFILVIAFLMALLRAAAPAVSSEMGDVTRFLSQVVGRPVHIQSLQLRWRRFLPVLDLTNVEISGDTPYHVGEIKLGWHFILLKHFSVDATSLVLPSGNASSYFKTIVLENADIGYKQYKLSVVHLTLRMRNQEQWSWYGRGVSVDFGKLFLAPLFLNSTSGNLTLVSQDNKTNITINDFSAVNEDVYLWAKCAMTFMPNASPVIDLEARYEVTPQAVKDLKNYLPQTIIDPDLEAWLTHSIKSIGSGKGKLILKGALSDFPYDKNPGQFLVDAEVNNGELQYFPGWPSVEKINAELIFSNTAMQIHVHSAETAHTPVQQVDVSIPVLTHNPVLTITGKVNTQIENGQYFIDRSPLKTTVGQKLNNMKWHGLMALGLEIHIPFAEKDPSTVKGTIEVSHSALTFPTWKISLNQLAGLIHFTEKGFSSPGLTAMIKQDPIKITIDDNSTYHVQYKKYKADISSVSGGWRAKIANTDWRGMFFIPTNVKQAGIKGTLYYLNADAMDLDTLSHHLQPSTLPPLSIEIQNLRYKSLRFNDVSFITQPLPSGLFARYVSIDGPGYEIDGQGKWFDNQQSVFSGKLNANDLSAMLSSWGLHPSIQGNSGQLNFTLSWPGQLYSPNINKISGNIDIAIGKGQMNTSGSQAKMDFGRLVTILSFQSLARRLSLDFSDITQKGLGFDSIEGRVQLNGKGVASVKRVLLQSSVATVELHGDIDLLSESYRLMARVTPHLTSSLPVIAALTGGPVAGAAVWAASKVVDPLLNQVTEDNYSVTGPWKNPTIKKV